MNFTIIIMVGLYFINDLYSGTLVLLTLLPFQP